MDETERDAAIQMMVRTEPGARRVMVARDMGRDTNGLVERCRERNITLQMARNTKRKGGSVIDGRTTRDQGYAVSVRIRKVLEDIFGWVKTIGGFRRTRYKGRDRTQLAAWLNGAAYNLMRVARIKALAA